MITGRVTDLTGQPLARSRVCVSSNKLAVECVACESDGQYSFAALPAGIYRMFAVAPGYLPSSARDRDELVSISAADATLRRDFALRPGGARVEGIVQDRGGGPIAAARIDALVADGPVTTLVSAITDDDGVFELTLEPGAAMLRVNASGYTATQHAVTAPNSALRIELSPASRLTGEVVSRADGLPLAGVVVTALAIASQSVLIDTSATTDDAGRFSIDGLPEGSYQLEGRGERTFGKLPQPVLLGAAQTQRNLRLLLDRAVTVSGKVVVGAAKKPCGQAQLGLVGPTFRASASADAAGTFKIFGVPAGTFDLSASCNAAVQPHATQIQVGSDDLTGIELTLPEGLAVRGRVVDGQGRGVAGRNVIAEPATVSVNARGALTSSAEQGEFELKGLALGNYSVMLEQQRDVKQIVSLSDGIPAAQIMLELPASGAIRVELRGAPEELGADWFVSAQGPRAHKVGSSRGGGVYELNDLLAGQYHVTAYDSHGSAFTQNQRPSIFRSSGESVVVKSVGSSHEDSRVHGNREPRSPISEA